MKRELYWIAVMYTCEHDCNNQWQTVKFIELSSMTINWSHHWVSACDSTFADCAIWLWWWWWWWVGKLCSPAITPTAVQAWQPAVCGSRHPILVYTRGFAVFCVHVWLLYVWFVCVLFVPSVLCYCCLGLSTCKNCLPYNLYCVGRDVKHCSIQS